MSYTDEDVWTHTRMMEEAVHATSQQHQHHTWNTKGGGGGNTGTLLAGDVIPAECGIFLVKQKGGKESILQWSDALGG